MTLYFKGLVFTILLLTYPNFPIQAQFIEASYTLDNSTSVTETKVELQYVRSSEVSSQYYEQSESAEISGWDISNLKESGNTLNTSDTTSDARAITLVYNDTRLFVHARGSQNVVTYDLAIPGDISSGTFVNEFDTSPYLGTESEGANGHGFYIRRDDMKRVWLWNRTEVWQFDLSTPGDMTTATKSGYKSLKNVVSRGHDIDFRPDGMAFFVEDRRKQAVHQFSMTESWNIETLEWEYSLDISDRHDGVRGIEFNPDGKIMFLLDTGLQEIQQYTLSEPWQISTAQFDKALPIDISNPRGLTWNSNGTSAYVMNASSRVITQYNIATTPVTVQLITPVNQEKDISLTAELEWQSYDNADYYEVQISEYPDFRSFISEDNYADTNYKISDLNNSTVYYWRVRFTIDQEHSTWSDVWSFETEAIIPEVPTLINEDGQQDASTTPRLEWNPANDAETYHLQLSNQSDFSELILNKGSLSDTWYELTEALDYSTTYHWRVRAGNESGKSNWSESRSFTTKSEASIPEVPTLKNEDGQQDASTTPRLEWNPANDAETYHLQLSNQSDFSELILDKGSLSDTWYEVIEALDYSKTYHWRVRAGNESGNSNWSESRSFNTKKRSLEENFEEVFELKQNYPNPFNPTTKIRYSITEQTRVKLEVYSLLGQRVAILVDENQGIGDYEVNFDASSLSSGLYFYRLNTGAFIQTRRMTLTK